MVLFSERSEIAFNNQTRTFGTVILENQYPKLQRLLKLKIV